ncbi:hypothetical protein KIM372_00500 [Bombiscardovia nodaiensis]|uniref:Uncharacterized protein n=1 Tax=Bombiscardovia nodaiensis TaxID=2932181 RepID=A0ABM8B5N5_9BIFI|nr:hypothetical protein KIM372_00500 [Bombiscardovia nodaiensis]
MTPDGNEPGSPGWGTVMVIPMAILASKVDSASAVLLLGAVAFSGFAMSWFNTRS